MLPTLAYAPHRSDIICVPGRVCCSISGNEVLASLVATSTNVHCQILAQRHQTSNDIRATALGDIFYKYILIRRSPQQYYDRLHRKENLVN